MRSRKYRVMTTLELGSNQLIRLALRAGLAPRAFALLDTTGRRTGLARHAPVGNGLDGDTLIQRPSQSQGVLPGPVTLTAHTLLGWILCGAAPRTSITRGLRPGR
jgi:hypothetical protein